MIGNGAVDLAGVERAPVARYAAGSWGPEEAEALAAPDVWRRP